VRYWQARGERGKFHGLVGGKEGGSLEKISDARWLIGKDQSGKKSAGKKHTEH